MDSTEQITITDLAYGGDGVGRLNGKAIFVPRLLPDEIASIQITEDKKRFAKGKSIDLISASAHRCASACPLFASCPGCAYQHMSYEHELTWKQNQLCNLLSRIGKLAQVPTFVPIGSPASLAYRNKIILHADGMGKLGYLGHDNQTVVDIPDCPLAVDPIRDALQTFREDKLSSLGAGDHVTFRWSETDGVVSWVNQNAPQQTLTEVVESMSWQVPVTGFWQVNHLATSILLKTVREMLKRCSYKYLIDLFCGAGFFTLGLGGEGTQALGVERDADSIRSAKLNAKQYPAVTFICGDAAKLYSRAQAQVPAKETLVLVDPPRRGLDKNLLADLMSDGGPRYLLYVSCAADTLARDCLHLQVAYDLRDIQMIDMFPRTAHFESIALFEKRT